MKCLEIVTIIFLRLIDLLDSFLISFEDLEEDFHTIFRLNQFIYFHTFFFLTKQSSSIDCRRSNVEKRLNRRLIGDKNLNIFITNLSLTLSPRFTSSPPPRTLNYELYGARNGSQIEGRFHDIDVERAVVGTPWTTGLVRSDKLTLANLRRYPWRFSIHVPRGDRLGAA